MDPQYNSQNNNQTYYQQPYPNPSAFRPALTRDMVYAVLMCIFSILCCDFFIWGKCSLGASFASVSLYIVGALYLWKYRRKVTVFGVLCSFAYLCGAATLTVSDNMPSKILIVIAMIFLSAMSIIELMDLKRYEDSFFGTVGDLMYTMFVLTFGKIGHAFYALFHKVEFGKIIHRKTGNVLIGLALAIPVCLIVVPLLSSSDAAFKTLIEQFSFEHIGEAIICILLGFLIFIMLFGRLFSLQLIRREKKTTVYDNRGWPTSILMTFLSVIAVFYVLYLVSQLAYFFSAFSGLLPKNFSTAAYARRGFFELLAVCAINLIIIFFANAVSKKQNGTAPSGVRALSFFYCVFSLILAATALSKMYLYIDRYGMTRLRIYASVFMIFLAVVILAVALKQLIRKVPYMRIAVITATLLLIFTCFADVDRVVAQYNTDAYLSGKLETVDMEALDALSSKGVVPSLIKLMHDSDPDVAQHAKEQLLEFAASYSKDFDWNHIDLNGCPVDTSFNWRKYNITEHTARTLLIENWSSYYDCMN